MLGGGAVDEVAALAGRGLHPALPVMRAIGVREIIAWTAGALSREATVARGQAATRQYAKRQYTWLAHQLPASWLRVETQLDTVESATEVTLLLHRRLTR